MINLTTLKLKTHQKTPQKEKEMSNKVGKDIHNTYNWQRTSTEKKKNCY